MKCVRPSMPFACCRALRAFAFADPTLTPGTTVIKAIHMNELRGIINAARSSLGLAAITYTNPSIVAPTSVISSADLNDLRNGVK